MTSNNNFDDDEEPNPEILSKDIIHSHQPVPFTSEKENNNLSLNKNNSILLKQQSKHFITIESKPKSKEPSLHNQSLNVSKANTCACVIPSKFENFDVQQLTYSIMKDYSQLRINKDENFMERMKFDIYKRQIKEDRVNQLVDQNKIRVEESDRVKAFNRLIEDANRRIEAQENLDKMKERLEEDILASPPKKYKDDEWKEIYEKRFSKYQEENQRKKEEKMKEKETQERKKEEELANLCKVIKAPQREINETSKRLYGESIKRQLKIENKLSKVNYEQSPTKYKKTVKRANYNFQSDNEETNNNKGKTENKPNPNDAEESNEIKRIIASEKKKPKQAVSEYNNKRFEVSYNQVLKTQKQPNKKEKVSIMQHNQQQDYLNQYLEDEEIIKDIPKPVNNNVNEANIKLGKGQMNQIFNHNTYDYSQIIKGNSNFLNKEKEANTIVDHFFTNKYKNG